MLGRPELADDERFRTNPDRVAHRDDLNAVLEGDFRSATSAEWLRRLEDAGVPAGPVHTVGDMLAHPQTLAREMVTEVRHTRIGEGGYAETETMIQRLLDE